MDKIKLHFEHDTPIAYECEECGLYCEREIDEDENVVCEQCGNPEVFFTTEHEDMICASCGLILGAWDDAYFDGEHYDLYCTDCGDKLIQEGKAIEE